MRERQSRGWGKGREWERKKKGKRRKGREDRRGRRGEQRRGREDDGLSCGHREFKVKEEAEIPLGV